MRSAALVFAFCAVTAVLAPAQAFTTLYSFCPIATTNCVDGLNPSTGLVQGTDGNLYGTTPNDSPYSAGSIFKITPDGAFTTLANVGSANALVQATDGNFYGTFGVDCYEFGGISKITPEGMLTTVHCFIPSDGTLPNALVQGTDGNFYGTTSYGGNYGPGCNTYWPFFGCGQVFKMTPDGTVTTLYMFMNNGDGARPVAPLIQAMDGNFYGTTEGAGDGVSTVFSITPDGKLTTLYSFGGNIYTVAPLVQGTDGNLYGTTYDGGDSAAGTVFKLSLRGTLTTLHSFCHVSGCFDDGSYPVGGLVQANDGNFYGTTSGEFIADCSGHAGSCGTVFKISSTGTFVTLHKFDFVNGASPFAGLAQGSDGTLYGTTYYGGATCDRLHWGCGTIFSLSPEFPLSVNKIGMGTVTSSDGHINCGLVCSWDYKQGATVNLQATPAPGWAFAGWSGCDNVNGNYCSVTMMTSAKKVTATFPLFILTSLTFKPSYVKGGGLSAGTLMLSGPAPQGGATIALSSDHPGVAHPPSWVFVPEGNTSVQFAVQTFPVHSNTTVTITANAGASQVNGTLTVGTTSLPPSVN